MCDPTFEIIAIQTGLVKSDAVEQNLRQFAETSPSEEIFGQLSAHIVVGILSKNFFQVSLKFLGQKLLDIFDRNFPLFLHDAKS